MLKSDSMFKDIKLVVPSSIALAIGMKLEFYYFGSVTAGALSQKGKL
jgi:hypothetical protein